MTRPDVHVRRPAGAAADAPASGTLGAPIPEAEVTRALLDLARSRRQGASFCPSEAARALAPADWRPLMPEIRRVAARLQRDGLLNVTQGGRPVDALAARGPIRLSRPLH